MHENSLKIIWPAMILTLTCVATTAQTTSAREPQIEYKRGQVWQYVGRQETITVLGVENIHKLGRVVHIRIDQIPAASCRGIHLTTTVDHVVLTEKMLRKSSVTLGRENVEIPDNYLATYREWQRQKKPHVLKDQTVEDVIRTTLQPGAVCNVFPRKT